MSPLDNSVGYYFQHICAVFFGTMLVSILLMKILCPLYDLGLVAGWSAWLVLSIAAGLGIGRWVTWLLTKPVNSPNALERVYRYGLLVSGLVAAVLGIQYALI